MLFTVWARPVKGKIKAYVSSAAFAEFYPISEPDARAVIGPDGYRYLTPAEIDALIANLRRLFAEIELRTSNS